MALAAGHAGQSATEITPMTFHARIDVLFAGCGVFRIHPIGRVFPGIGIKRRLVIRRAAAPGNDRKTNEKQDAEPSQRNYL
jgi:hypothetical protein